MIPIGKPENSIPLRRSRRRWEDHLNEDWPIKERGRGSVKWTHLAQDRVYYRAYVNTNEALGFYETPIGLLTS